MIALETQMEYFLRMALASVCGAAIGFERTKRQKEAGIRTHIIVALGSALMMLVSKYAFYDVVVKEGISLDASRIAANVITGISFLGAGVIFIKNDYIKGLTTAAGVWATSGVGLALGGGLYFIGISATMMLVGIQVALHSHMPASELMTASRVTIVLLQEPGALEDLKEQFVEMHLETRRFSVEKHPDKTITVKAVVRAEDALGHREAIRMMEENPMIQSVLVA